MNHKNQTNSYIDFFYKAFRNILLVSIPLVVVLGFVLSSLHSSASTDQIEFSLSVSCTMSSIVNSAHTKEITNGTYHSDVGKTTITALCNDGNGYTVYATGYSNNEVGNNKLINTTNSQYSIDTGLATSGSTSQWAVKLNNLENDPSSTPPIIESAYDDTYGLVPSSWTKVASRPSGTTDMNLGSSFTTTYSIYTSSSQFAGTYRGQVKYALLHPYKNDNVMSLEDSFALHGKEKVTVTDPITGETGSYYKMQDMESGICNIVDTYGEASATRLVDIRDNKLYWIAKLADNHCWMTQNLDLDLSHEVALTSETSDIDPDTYNTGIYTEATGYSRSVTTGVVSWTPSTIDSGGVQRADTIPMNWSSITTASVSKWVDNSYQPYSADAGDRYKYTDENGNETVYTSFEACHIATNDVEGCQHIHIGNYYNWPATIASNNTIDVSGDQVNSICPKSWDLPVNGEYSIMLQAQKVYTGLNNSYDMDGFLKIRTLPLYFVMSGYVGAGELKRFDTYGLYWSSTPVYVLRFSSYDVIPNNGDNAARGWSVRCVARE